MEFELSFWHNKTAGIIHNPWPWQPENRKFDIQSINDFKRQPGFDPITFSENSNYGWESLLEV